MTVLKDTGNWIALAEYDLDTARHMLASGRYLYVVFLCHLSLENSMAQTTPELKQIIERFRQQLEKVGIHPLRIMLFGSHASGTAREGSDIDLIVISDDWIKYNHRERLEILGVAAARILEPVQAQGFTTDEIGLKQITPFWEHIMKEQAIAV